MSSYHVLRASDDGETLTVVVHVPVPAEQNQAGKTLAACIVEDPDAPDVTVLPTGHLGAGEATAIAAGTLVEHTFTFRMHPGRSDADRRAQLEQQVSNIVNALGPERLRRRYRQWGYGRTV